MCNLLLHSAVVVHGEEARQHPAAGDVVVHAGVPAVDPAGHVAVLGDSSCRGMEQGLGWLSSKTYKR